MARSPGLSLSLALALLLALSSCTNTPSPTTQTGTVDFSPESTVPKTDASGPSASGPSASGSSASGSSVSEPQPVETDDVFRIEYAIDPRITPDGERVVFVRESVDLMDDRWHGNLWTVDVGTAEMRQLTSGHHYDSSPRISPDSRRVAFFSDRSGALQVYVKSLDASVDERAAPLTGLGPMQDPWGLAWSPDGTTLSFVAREFADPPFLGELSLPPADAIWAEPPRVVDRLVYRHDGRGFVPPGCERIFLVAADGGPPRRATAEETCLDEATAGEQLNHGRSGNGPSWSPDGRHLVVAANRRVGADRSIHPIDLDLYEIDIETGALRPLVVRNGLDHLPVVSPDGSHIAFVGFDDRSLSFQDAEVYLANRNGSEMRSLTADLDRDVDGPRWSADGESIYFSYHDWGTTRVARVSLDGAVTEIASGLSDGYSAYDGGGFSVAQSGRVAFTHSSPVQAGEVAVAAEGEPLRRLSRLNDNLMRARRVAKVEEVAFDSRDGTRIQGWWMPPLEGETKGSAGSAPLVLDIHGGPFLNWGKRFDLEKQILAARGFGVLYVNPRGSSGYGEDFANLIHHAYPGDDRHDLLSAVDLLVERGDADPEQLFVTGGSGGGLLTFSLLAETQRFRAAVAIYPLVSWTSFVLTTDLAPIVLTRWLPGPPWEHQDHYLERSPLWKVDRMNTPTLVIAGEEDHRTPMSEAEQVFAALQWRGVESVLVRLPETPHFAERRPSHYRARIAYGLHWFERHLGTRDGPGEPAGDPAPPDSD